MEGTRLILPKRQHQRPRLFMVALVAFFLGVVGVWGLQMKMTFDRFAAASQEGEGLAPLERLEEAREEYSVEKPAALTEVEAAVKEMLLEEQAKQEVREMVTEEMKAELAGSSPNPSSAEEGSGAPAGTVAGEQIEAEAN